MDASGQSADVCGAKQSKAVLEHSAVLLLVFSLLLLMHAAIHCCARRVQALQCVVYSNKSVKECALLLAQCEHVSVWLQSKAIAFGRL